MNPVGEIMDDADSERGRNNSSRTRVLPVFAALERRTDDWVRALLDLADIGDPYCCSSGRWSTLRLLPTAVSFADRQSDRRERSFKPPRALLRWLIENASPGPGQELSSDPETRKLRERLLINREESARDQAFRDLETGGQTARWCTLEGPTYPDVVIETPDALVIVEGKFTERGPTTHTTWMSGRHQMLRHLDGAWEARGERAVFGIFAVEGEDPDPRRVPVKWQIASRHTRSIAATEGSLPHRSVEDRRAIADALVGVVTWQAVADGFELPAGILTPRL